jgi:hypothetical protein
MSKSRQEAILVDPLYRKLILGATAIGFNDGTLGITSLTAATPGVVTLATLNAYQIHEHYWPDNMTVSVSGGTAPLSLNNVFKIKQVAADPDAVYLYTLKDAPVGFTATERDALAGDWVVRPIIPKDYFFAQIRVETGAIRYRCDGVIPDANNGIYVGAGGSFQYNGDMDNLKFFAVDNDSPVIHALITKTHEALGTPTGSTTATVSAGTRVNTTGHNGTGSATVANPQPVETIKGTAVNSESNPENVAVNGLNGTGIATLVNAVPVIEGYFTQFARSTFHGLAVQATTAAAVDGTAGMKVFGFDANTGHVNMGFKARRVMIRNNGATPVHLGWVAGESTTGGVIDNIVMSGADHTKNILVTTKAAHGILEGSPVPVYLAATGGLLSQDIVCANGYHAVATYAGSTTQFTLGFTNLDTGTEVTTDWGYWYKGFDGYCQPAVYTEGAVALGGYYCEASSIPGDWVELPYNIAALFVLNPAGGAQVTNTPFKAEVIFLR